MPFDVTLDTGESQESLLHRFQKMVQMSGMLREFRSRQRFVSKRNACLVKAKIPPEEKDSSIDSCLISGETAKI